MKNTNLIFFGNLSNNLGKSYNINQDYTNMYPIKATKNKFHSFKFINLVPLLFQ